MTLLQDLRHAIRVLRHERGYALVALLAIALGVGATTTLFSVTYGVLLKQPSSAPVAAFSVWQVRNC